MASYFSQLSPDNMSDNDLVNIYPVGGGLVAATETDIVHSFDPETLETKERVSIKTLACTVLVHFYIAVPSSYIFTITTCIPSISLLIYV